MKLLAEKEGLGSSLVQAGGRISEAALQSGLPQLLAGKNPATILAEQTTGIIGVGALGGVAIIAVGGIVYVMVKASGNDDEKEKQQSVLYGYNFRG